MFGKINIKLSNKNNLKNIRISNNKDNVNLNHFFITYEYK